MTAVLGLMDARLRQSATCAWTSGTGLTRQDDKHPLRPARPGPVAVVTHGGITADQLRTVLGDDALPPHVLDAGIPPCAVTAVDDLNVVMIASTSHLL